MYASEENFVQSWMEKNLKKIGDARVCACQAIHRKNSWNPREDEMENVKEIKPSAYLALGLEILAEWRPVAHLCCLLS